MVSDHINYLTFEDPGAVHTVRRALKLAEAGDLHGAAETAGVDVSHAAVVSQGLRRGMRFSIGAELDNDPRARPDAQNIVDAMRPDGMIRSVHFVTIEHPEKGPEYQWAFDNPEFRELHDVVGAERLWELYMAKLLEDLRTLPGQIVGHFYAPADFGHWPAADRLEAYEDQLLEVCAERGIAVEINTRYLYREEAEELQQRYRDALLRLMRKAKARNVGIAIGSDAHSPKDQGGSFAAILPLLDEAEINEIVFPVAGRLARVALRATKEHLQRVKAAEPAPQPGSSISGFSRAELGLPEREEEPARETSRSKVAHDDGPRKRASGPTRATKKPVKSTSERSVAAAEDAPKPAKAAKTAKPAKPAKTVEKPAPKPAKPVKTAKPVKAAAKPPVKAVAAQTKAPSAKAKPAAVKPAAVKPAAAKAAPAKTKAAPKAKPAVKAKPVKAPVKKSAPAKKTAPVKKTVKKAPPAKNVAKKPAAKKTVANKTSAKKATVKKATVKAKVSTTKRAATKKTPAKRR